MFSLGKFIELFMYSMCTFYIYVTLQWKVVLFCFVLNQSDVLSTQYRNFLFSFKLLEFLQDICSDVTAKKQAGAVP